MVFCKFLILDSVHHGSPAVHVHGLAPGDPAHVAGNGALLLHVPRVLVRVHAVPLLLPLLARGALLAAVAAGRLRLVLQLAGGAEFSASLFSPLHGVPFTGRTHPGHILPPVRVPRVPAGDNTLVAHDNGCQGQQCESD